MAMSRRTQRGGPMGAAGARTPEGARLVTPATSKAAQQQMRAAMNPARPGRGRVIGERLNLDFFREAWSELRKVHWPTPEQARNLTALVIGVSAAVGVILGGVDYIFEQAFEVILRAS